MARARQSTRPWAGSQVIADEVLSREPEALRLAAREMLRNVLSCRDGMTSSGAVARVAGDAVGADQFLPNMATDAFLKCLSKAAMERAASASNVLPAARFALTTDEVAKLGARTAGDAAGPDTDEDDLDGLLDDVNDEGPSAVDVDASPDESDARQPYPLAAE